MTLKTTEIRSSGREHKKCARKKFTFNLTRQKIPSMLASRHIIFQHQTWVKIPALERKDDWRVEIWKSATLLSIFARLGYSLTPNFFDIIQHLLLPASIIHTFFRHVTRAWAHRIFYEFLLLWIGDMPSLEIFLHSTPPKTTQMKEYLKIFAQDFYAAALWMKNFWVTNFP